MRGTIGCRLSSPPFTPAITAGDIPLDEGIREGADRGCPVVAGQPDSALTAAYMKIAGGVLDSLPQLDDPLTPR